MARALITGGAGFIGSHLSEALLEQGWTVEVVDDLSTGSIENISHLKGHPHFAYTLDSVMNRSLMLELVDRADVIFHLAAAVGVLSFAAQLLMTHAYGALTIAEAALWQQLTPLASYGWALFLLDERLTWLAALGVFLGGAGIAYGTVLGHRPVGGRPGTTEVVEPVEPA